MLSRESIQIIDPARPAAQYMTDVCALALSHGSLKHVRLYRMTRCQDAYMIAVPNQCFRGGHVGIVTLDRMSKQGLEMLEADLIRFIQMNASALDASGFNCEADWDPAVIPLEKEWNHSMLVTLLPRIENPSGHVLAKVYMLKTTGTTRSPNRELASQSAFA